MLRPLDFNRRFALRCPYCGAISGPRPRSNRPPPNLEGGMTRHRWRKPYRTSAQTKSALSVSTAPQQACDGSVIMLEEVEKP